SRLRLPFPPPYLKPGANFSKGINFASGGSGLLLSTGKEMNIIPLEVQIQQFTNISLKLAEEYGVNAAKSMIGRSLFAVSIGGNDLGLNYLVNATFQNTTSPQALIQMLLGKYTQYLTAMRVDYRVLFSLYRDEARNFLLFDMSPVGCTPNFRLAGLATWNGECVESGNQLAMAYNVGFKQLMMNITTILKEATILTTNTYSLADNITRHGEAYGFSEVRSACCGAGPFNSAVSCGKPIPEDKIGEYTPFLCKHPSKYLFWDGTHPTERFYKLVSHQVWEGTSVFISPFNLKTLIKQLNHKH
ncbi:hypothetical protein KI387_015811, partial [Taxus chinensis]